MRFLPNSFIAALLTPALALAGFLEDVAYISTECLPALHYDHIKSSLHIFAKSHNLSDDEMAQRLLFIADPANRFTDSAGCSQTQAALGAICFFRNARSALPELEKYILCPETCFSSLCAYSYITRYDTRYFTFVRKAVENGKLDKKIVCTQLFSAASNPDTETWKTNQKSRLMMYRAIMDFQADDFDSSVYSDRFMGDCLFGYTNSVEHVKAQENILSFLNKSQKRLSRGSFYRGEWGGGNVSDEEWYCRATNSCQSEIARVMALPEDERLNMTAILDAKIAAIEEEEARAARRAMWKRRVWFSGGILLAIALVALLARKV